MTDITSPRLGGDAKLARNGRGEFERSPEQAEFDRRAVEAYGRLHSFRKAAKELGCSHVAVYHAWQRAIAEAGPVASLNELRTQSMAELDEAIAMAWSMARKVYPVYWRGQPVEGSRDMAPNLAAIREIRLLNESRRRLAGQDAPTQVRVTVRDEVAAEIEQLLTELGLPDPALLAE